LAPERKTPLAPLYKGGDLVRDSQHMQFQIPKTDWATITNKLDAQGSAVIPSLLTPKQCEELIALYTQPSLFRSRIAMERYNFGKGEYQYFAYPLPEMVANLRTQIYLLLVPIANR